MPNVLDVCNHFSVLFAFWISEKVDSLIRDCEKNENGISSMYGYLSVVLKDNDSTLASEYSLMYQHHIILLMATISHA